MIKVFGKPIRVNKAASDKRTLEVGANLFIGNLDPDVDEKVRDMENARTDSKCMHLFKSPFGGALAVPAGGEGFLCNSRLDYLCTCWRVCPCCCC